MEAVWPQPANAEGILLARISVRALKLPRPSIHVPRLRVPVPSIRGLSLRRLGRNADAETQSAESDASAPAGSGRSGLRPYDDDITVPQGGPPDDRRGSVRATWRSPLLLAIIAVTVAVAFIAGLTYYGAREFSGRAADTRASNEAQSFASHSSTLATGDAFDGYIQILRDADDPVVSSKASTANDRTEALQNLLYLNTNKFTSLTLADRAGLVLATTDSTIASVQNSTAFSETRANLNPANSDIILPEAGKHGYVEYSAPLHDADGTVWAVLVARADPARIWKGTLAAAVDGSRNVIINSQGQFSAGVPDELLRQPWHGEPMSNGAVRANIAGIDSICGLALIGKDTQIDRGLNVASCLPASIIQTEQHRATDKQALITVAGAVLAIVLAATSLMFGLRGTRPPLAAAAAPIPPVQLPTPAVEATAIAATIAVDIEDDDLVSAFAPPPVEAAPEPMLAEMVEAAEAASEPGRALPPPAPVEVINVIADVNALALIDAYEQRNARLAQQIRERVQAKLMIAATQADEAYKLGGADDELAATLHAAAMEDLENIRERELRAIGQELYPGLVRMGLPAALKALQKEMAPLITVELDIDAAADSVAGGPGRATLAPAMRLALYRVASDAAHSLTQAGARICRLSLKRDDRSMTLAVAARARDGADASQVETSDLTASTIAMEAYGGTLAVARAAGDVIISVSVHAPPVGEQPAIELIDDEDESTDTAVSEPPGPLIETERPAAAVTLVIDDGGEALSTRIEKLQAEMFGALVVTLNIADEIDAKFEAAISTGASSAIEELARATLVALKDADARTCVVSLSLSASDVVIELTAAGATAAIDETQIDAMRRHIEQIGGSATSDAADGDLRVAAHVPPGAEAPVEAPRWPAAQTIVLTAGDEDGPAPTAHGDDGILLDEATPERRGDASAIDAA
jgi:hypothetical protein